MHFDSVEGGRDEHRPHSLPLCIRLSFYFLNLFPFKMCVSVCMCVCECKQKKEEGVKTGITSPCE